MVAKLPAGAGLSQRRVSVQRQNVAWLRYVLEAHEGLAMMHSDGSGMVTLLTPHSQVAALDALIADLVAEGCLEHGMGEPHEGAVVELPSRGTA